jgi:hypothetical protein
MSGIEIVPVRSKAELQRFIRLPARLYANDPQFVPPLEMERSDALTRGKNPYFEHAEVQFFLAVRDGRDVGRISAQVDNLVKDPDVGHFGLLAAAEDPAVFASLFSAAEGWLRGKGKRRAQGPFNLSINEETVLLVEGFDTPPVVFMPHDPQYAAAQVERQGYAKAKDVIAYIYDFRELPVSVKRVIQRYKPGGMRVRHLDFTRYGAEFDTIRALFNDAWSENWGFVPFTEAEFKHLAKGLKPFLDPKLGAIVEVDGEPVGFGILLPNLNEAIRDFNGRLLPFNWLKLILRLKRGLETSRVPLMGIKRSYAGGLASGLVPFLIIDSMRTRALERGFKQVELSWILEDNLPMRRIIEALGATAYKTYRVYEKQLA